MSDTLMFPIADALQMTLQQSGTRRLTGHAQRKIKLGPWTMLQQMEAVADVDNTERSAVFVHLMGRLCGYVICRPATAPSARTRELWFVLFDGDAVGFVDALGAFKPAPKNNVRTSLDAIKAGVTAIFQYNKTKEAWDEQPRDVLYPAKKADPVDG